eukprot:442674-Prymnesium_polylepis.1
MYRWPRKRRRAWRARAPTLTFRATSVRTETSVWRVRPERSVRRSASCSSVATREGFRLCSVACIWLLRKKTVARMGAKVTATE